MTRLLLVLLCAIPYAGCNGCWDQTAYAGGCYQKAIVQPYYVKQIVQPVYQNVQYLVGYPVRIDAMVQAELKASPEYAEMRNYQQFKTEFEAFLEFKKQQAAVPEGALPQRQSLIESRCVRCHSPNSPNGPGGGYDFSGPLTTDDLKAIKEVLPTGKMPKPGSKEADGFSNELAGQLILESIDRLGDDTPEQPQQPPFEDVPPPPPEPPVE